jgi:hypothetical protein
MANKYNAKKVRTSAGIFDSMGEYRYFQKLQLLKNATDPAEKIVSIDRQVTYSLAVNGVYIGNYRADFVVKYANGREEVHDFKNPYLVNGKGKSSPAAQIFNYKKKLMFALHGIDIIVVTNYN